MKPTAYTPIRRTKIVATLGPASDREGVLEGMLRAGVDVVRLNFSHGSADDHRRRLVEVREISQRLGQSVAVLADLQGPKIRIARFKDDSVLLGEGQPFVLDMLLDSNAGDITRVGCDYKTLADDVIVGDRLLLDDGRLVLEVSAIEGQEIHTRVVLEVSFPTTRASIRREAGCLRPLLPRRINETLRPPSK